LGSCDIPTRGDGKQSGGGPRLGSYDVLEHTADIGLVARAVDLNDLFATATEGMATIAGVYRPGGGESVRIHVEGSDVEGLLVDWLNEVLYEHDSRGAALRAVTMASVESSAVTGSIEVTPLSDRDDEGIQIKAVTYHQLEVKRTDDGWEARVFFDV
jgi:SHS2 domain-containing protein